MDELTYKAFIWSGDSAGKWVSSLIPEMDGGTDWCAPAARYKLRRRRRERRPVDSK